MDDSPLSKLPAELRNHIWEYVLLQDFAIMLDHHDPQPKHTKALLKQDKPRERRNNSRRKDAPPKVPPLSLSPVQADKASGHTDKKRKLIKSANREKQTDSADSKEQRQKTQLFREETALDGRRTSFQILALTATCKALHEECTKLFYNINYFKIPHRDRLNGQRALTASKTLKMLRDSIGAANFSAISNIFIDIETDSTDSFQDGHQLHDLLEVTKLCHGQKTRLETRNYVLRGMKEIPPYVIEMQDVKTSWRKILRGIPWDTQGHGNVRREYRVQRFEFGMEVGRFLIEI